MALFSYSSRNELSVYNLIKQICNKFVEDERNIKGKKSVISKRLLSEAYEVLIFKDCDTCNYSAEELRAAILFRAANFFIHTKNAESEKYKRLEGLIQRLEKINKIFDLNAILKFFYCLHIYNNSNEQYNSEESLTSSSISFSLSNEVRKDGLDVYSAEKIYPYWIKKKEPIIFGLDIVPNMLLLRNLEKASLQRGSTTYISKEDLLRDVKYALIGIQSSSFIMEDGCIKLKNGLYTDGIDFQTLVIFMEPIVISSNSYSELVQLCEDCTSLCSIATIPSIKHFLELYSKLVEDIPKTLSLTSWKRYIYPLYKMMDTLRYFTTLFSNSKEFLEKVYNFSIKEYLPQNMSFIVNTFLITYCDVYFQILDDWVFTGSCSSYLFVVKDLNVIVECKTSWLKLFTFVKEEAPSFLPCTEIFECGRKVALLKLCSESDLLLLNLLSKDSSRPKIRLCKSLADLQVLKERCVEYATFITSLRNDRKKKMEEIFSKYTDKNYPIEGTQVLKKSPSGEVVKNLECNTSTFNQHDVVRNLPKEIICKQIDENLNSSDGASVSNSPDVASVPNPSDVASVSDDVISTQLNYEKTAGSSSVDCFSNKTPTLIPSEVKPKSCISIPPKSEGFNSANLLEEEMQNIQKIPLRCKDAFRTDNVFTLEILRKCVPFEDDICIEGFKDNAFFIKEILIRSILIPLKMQEKLVNEALMHVFLFEHKFLSVAENLTNVFFFMDCNICTPLVHEFSKVVEKESPTIFLTYPKVKRLLDSNILRADKSFYFKITCVPLGFDICDPEVFSCINLTYDADWPINLLITPKMIEKYNTVFQFLMAVERTSWNLNTLFIKLKNIEGRHFKDIQLHRFTMTQFVNVLKSYIHNVVTTNWIKFQNSVSSIGDLFALYKCHVEFIKTVRFMCFLGKPMTKLSEELMRLLRFILEYCQIAVLGQWTVSEDFELGHSKFSRLRHHFDCFIQLARYITAYLERIVEQRYKSEFEGLLQSLNVNSFYSYK